MPSKDNGARLFCIQNRRALDVWPPQPIAMKLVRGGGYCESKGA